MNNTKNTKISKDIFILFEGLKIEQFTVIPKMRSTFKWNIKKRISDLDMTQDEVSKRLGWNPTALSKMISGKPKILMSDLKKLCELLNITPEEIFLS